MSVAVHPSVADHVTSSTSELRLLALAPRPKDLAESGLSERFVAELVVKHLHGAGTLTLAELSKRVALSGSILERVLNFMRREALVEIGTRSDGHAALPYALTERGRNAALDALMRSGYIGPAPVPLEEYVRVAEAQSVHSREVERDAVYAAFEGMAISRDRADQFGISINSGRAVFIYGPAGTGKTYVTQRLARLFREVILIPHAVSIDETVVQLFDPLLHKKIDSDSESKLMFSEDHDPRFIACERPVVITGGELTMDLLDVRFDTNTRTYEAPLQLKANNGMFVIDDLGRQKASPDALLNRWIVPMNEQRDYHALGSGRHFVAPFDVVLVFSSNLHPLDLADEAFLRRIGHKIYCGYISADDYERIWAAVCAQRDVSFDPDLVNYVVDELHRPSDVPLLPCHPKDLIGIALDKAAYYGTPGRLSRELLEWAWDTYFVSLHKETSRIRDLRGKE